MSKRVKEAITIFDTTLSAAEWAWRITAVLLIGGSGTVGSLVARADPFFKQLGPIYWLAVALVTAVGASVVLYLVKSANLKQSLAELNATMAAPRSGINPLATSFQDLIIRVEDLRLPMTQLHENKHFKRCKFVGPGTIAIQGGTYANTGFIECGDTIALPEGAFLTGITALRNCTVEECEFIRVTVFCDQGTARSFARIPGAAVKGLA